ncbi:hypothetical protein ACFQQB_45180 [Nonomuraea rubra]|uniref:hypothetical protein n=1 Tax=Nonomuraea rubra TaxID=46180 RepID=UPI00360CC557
MKHIPRVNVDVRPLGEDAAVLITPNGRMFEIDRPAADVVRALEDLAATPPGASPPWPELAGLLASTGSLIEPPQPPVLLADADLHPIVTRLAAPGEQTHPMGGDVPLDRPLALLSTRFDPELLLRVDGQRTGPWTCFFLDQGKCYFGPAIEPGRTAPYRDLLTRRACVTQRPDLADALLQPSLTGGLRPPSPDVLTWLVSMFLVELRRWLAGEPCALAGNEVEVDPAGPQIRLHPFLPCRPARTRRSSTIASRVRTCCSTTASASWQPPGSSSTTRRSRGP